MKDNMIQLEQGLQTAFIDSGVNSNLAYRPRFVSNNYKEGKKVISSIHRYMQSVGIAGMTGRGYRNLYRPVSYRTAGGSCV